MAKTSSTKRALISALLALVMTVSMLVGTTFAWFTDSVTSADNKIVAGNLDVELYLYDGDSYENISDATQPIFGSNGLAAAADGSSTIWEPGKTQVAYLAIRNAGTLGLNYKVSLDVTNIENNLNEVLTYTITPNAKGEAPLNSWDAAAALSVDAGSQIVSDSKVPLEAGAWHYFALSVHMDEEAGNEYMFASISFDLTILATQLASEDDSFGNKYDEDATYPVDVNVVAPVVPNDDTTVSKELQDSELSKIEAVVPSEALADGVESITLTVKETDEAHSNVVVGDGERVLNYDIHIEGLAEDNTEPVVVTLSLPAGLKNVVLYHNGVEIPSTYDIVTGKLTFATADFSPFSVVFEQMIEVEASNSDIINGAFDKGGNIVVEGTVNPESTSEDGYELAVGAKAEDFLFSGGNIVLDNSAKYGIYAQVGSENVGYIANTTITANSQWSVMACNRGTLYLRDVNIEAQKGSGFYSYYAGTTILDNVKINHKCLDEAYSDTPWAATAVALSNGQTMVINSGVYAGSNYGVYIYSSGGNLTINGGTFVGKYVIAADAYGSGYVANVVINGGNFDGAIQSLNVGNGGKSSIVINGGNFTNFVNAAGSRLKIYGGTFDSDPTSWIADGCAAVANGDGTWTVYNAGSTIVLEDGATLNLNGKNFNGNVVALGDLNIVGNTSFNSLSATNGGTITIEDGKTLTLKSFSFGTKATAGSEYVIKGGTIKANYGFFQHGSYDLYSNFETGYMYYSYGSDITLYGTFHSQGTGDALDYIRGTLTVANGGKSIHDKSLWVGQPAGWGAMNATLIVEDGGYVCANSLSVYEGSQLLVAPKGTVEAKSLSVSGESYVYVKNADELIEALENDKDVCFANDIKIDPASMSNAYGATGINIKYGQTINGNGYVLNIAGAGGTWDSGINTTGGIIKNLDVTGSFRGVFINHTSTESSTVILDNVNIYGTVYTVSCDQGMRQNLVATNSTFYGWTSFAETLGTATFENCTFGEGSGYAFCRPYAETTFVGCTFEEGYEFDTTYANITFDGCYYGETLITAENATSLKTGDTVLFYNGLGKATIK